MLALGEAEGFGAEVVALVAGHGSMQQPGLAAIFWEEELRQLLEHERRAAVHALVQA